MVYTLCKYSDETLVTFSDIRKKDNGDDEYIRVSFERPRDYGFDTISPNNKFNNTINFFIKFCFTSLTHIQILHY